MYETGPRSVFHVYYIEVAKRLNRFQIYCRDSSRRSFDFHEYAGIYALVSTFNRLIHGTVNVALCLNSGKCRLTTTTGERRAVCCGRCAAGFPLKKYLGEIERQINARANAHHECVVFSRSFQRAKILPDNLVRVSYASLLESRSLNALLCAMKLAFKRLL